MQYTENEILRLAKRNGNKKRSYLLLNPLQGKHDPVSPTASLAMMKALGEKARAAYPGTKLVIGFAETATAIGAAVADEMGPGCLYIHTTREDVGSAERIEFLEEHSHAMEQQLCTATLAAAAAASSCIMLVDDEISTGKTLINIVTQLRTALPELADKPVAAVSIINRVSADNEARLAAAGITCACLLKLPDTDYESRMAPVAIDQPDTVDAAQPMPAITALHIPLPAPRRGVEPNAYRASCQAVGHALLSAMGMDDDTPHRVLVLGTEECMYPALTAGRMLEEAFPRWQVRCHATTRSPIGVSQAEGYPIRSGHALRSVYDPARPTFLYNMQPYDAAVIVTDAPHVPERFHDVCRAVASRGCPKILIVHGG